MDSELKQMLEQILSNQEKIMKALKINEIEKLSHELENATLDNITFIIKDRNGNVTSTI